MFYFGNVNQFDDDFSSMLRRAATQNHTLHPLGEAVEQVDRPL